MVKGTAGKRTIIYGRVSFIARRGGKSPTNETSVDRQFKACEQFAAGQGWKVVARAEDRGVSAFKKDVERPGWSKVVEAVETDAVDIVLVSALDRAGRNIVKLMEFVELCEDHKVRFVTAIGGIDTGSEWSTVILTVMAGIAQMESKIKRERTLAKHAEDAEAGRAVGQRFRTFGYTRQMEQVPEEVDAIRTAVEGYLNHGTIGDIVRDWNGRGIKTTAGGTWTTSNVGRLLENPQLAGIREHNGTLHDGAWKPILTKGTRDRILDRLAENRARHVAPKSARYLLVPLLRCGICGNTLTGGVVGGKRRYICKKTGSSHLGIEATSVENFVGDAASIMLVKRTKVRDPRELSKALLVQLDDVNDKIAEAVTNAAEAGLSATDIRRGTEKFVARRAEIEQQLEQQPGEPERPEPVWKLDHGDYTPEWRAMIAARVESATVKPVGRGGNMTPVQDRVDIAWGDGVIEGEPR